MTAPARAGDRRGGGIGDLSSDVAVRGRHPAFSMLSIDDMVESSGRRFIQAQFGTSASVDGRDKRHSGDGAGRVQAA